MARRTTPRPASGRPGIQPRQPRQPRSRAGEASPAALAAGGAPLDARLEVERLDRLAELLDSRYRIPVVGWRFGLDAILGLVPGLGDAAAFGPSAYLIYRGYKLGVPRHVLARMAGNTALDFAVGSVPLLGSVFDVFFKANLRNIDLLKREIGRRGERAEPRA